MTNFIFSRASPTSKKLANTSLESVMNQLLIIQKQNRFLRQDMIDVKLMLNKLLVNKHLQMQVDNYYGNDSEHFEPEDKQPEEEPAEV